MILPNKVIPIEESILYKMGFILEGKLEKQHLADLFSAKREHFFNVDEFLMALDVLYVLGCIDVDFDLGRIHYAD